MSANHFYQQSFYSQTNIQPRPVIEVYNCIADNIVDAPTGIYNNVQIINQIQPLSSSTGTIGTPSNHWGTAYIDNIVGITGGTYFPFLSWGVATGGTLSTSGNIQAQTLGVNSTASLNAGVTLGNISTSQTIVPSASATYDLGATGNGYKNLFSNFYQANTGIYFFNSAGSGKHVMTDYEDVAGTNFTFSGPWASSQTASVSFTRAGNIVTMRITTLDPNGNNSASTISTSNTVPSELRPPNSAQIPILIINNNTNATGLIAISNVGAITIFSSPASGQFQGNATACGWPADINVSWSLLL